MSSSGVKVSPSTLLPVPTLVRKRTILAAVLFADDQPPSPLPPPAIHPTQSRDYTRFVTSEERVHAAYKAYKRDILDVHGSSSSSSSQSDSTLDLFGRHTIKDFMSAQKALGLTDDELLALHEEIEYQQVVEKREERREERPFRILGLFLKTTMGYVDMGSDVATLVKYVTLNPSIAIAQGCVLGFSFLAQFLSSVALGQPLWVGLVGLIGLKPMLEAWRDAMEEKPFPGQKLGNDGMLFLGRITEMTVSACGA